MTANLIRVTGIHKTSSGVLRVSYFIADLENEMNWAWEAPQIGDVIEIDPLGEKPPQLIGRAQEGAWLGKHHDGLRWRQPIDRKGTTRIEILRQRHIIRRAVRSYLDQEGFTEIDSPLLVRGTTPDSAVDSFALNDRYLVTSTEYQMKRLAVGGLDRLYSLTQNFRMGDTGSYRNPEFTMLEWGRVGTNMTRIETDAEQIILSALRALCQNEVLNYQGKSIDMRTPWPRMSVAEAIESTTGVAIYNFSSAECARAAEAVGMTIKPEWLDHSDFVFSLLMDHIQPQLGINRPVFLTHWPLGQTATAATNTDNKTITRSELFIGGVELSDGFAGLAEHGVQSYMFDLMMAKRRAERQTEVMIDKFYLEAMKLGAPYGAGMALGFDRLVMLLTDQETIRNTLAFAWDEV